MLFMQKHFVMKHVLKQLFSGLFAENYIMQVKSLTGMKTGQTFNDAGLYTLLDKSPLNLRKK